MKKNILTCTMFLLLLFVFVKCTKNDPEPVYDLIAPVLTLNGDTAIYIDLGTPFTDPGYTITDNMDATPIVVVDGNVDVNNAGIYYISYSATDASGNKSNASRTVYVVIRRNNVIGNYTVNENCLGAGGPYTVGPYATSITAGSVDNFAITLNNFGDFTSTINLNGAISGVTGENIIIQDYTSGLTISGSGSVNPTATSLNISYSATDGVNTDNCTSNWVKL